MSSEPLAIGVIGLGAMGTDHLDTLTRHVPQARVAQVFDASAAATARAVAATGAQPANEATEVVTAKNVEAVVVCSPDTTHLELVQACIARGKPVLCEKPLGVDAAESQQVVKAEEEAGRRLVSVGFMRRFDPTYRQLRAELGSIGNTLLVHNVHRNAAPHPEATSEGLVVNSMVHELDVLPWLLGRDITAIEVRSPRHEGLRDPQVALVELDGGEVLATIEVYLGAGYGYDIRCEVVASKGCLALGDPASLWRAGDGRAGTDVPRDFRDRFATAYRSELQEWVTAARHGGQVGASAWDGHRANLVAAAGVASLRHGGWVEVATPRRPSLYDVAPVVSSPTGS